MIYEEHPNFEKPTNPSAALYRYTSFSKFIALVHYGTLHFTVASKLDDNFEGTLPSMNLKKMDAETITYYDQSRSFHLINCWHLGDESAAMWQIYCRNGEGIAVQTTFDRLARSFLDEDDRFKGERVHIGLVKYIDFRKEAIPDDELNTLFSPVLYKRKHFEFEHEVRAVYRPFGTTQGSQLTLAALRQGARNGVDIRVDLQTLIERIIIAPSAPDWFYDLVRSILPESFVVEFSHLDDLPQTAGRSRARRQSHYLFPDFGLGIDSSRLDELAYRAKTEKDAGTPKPNDS